jgi:hypothetical protein
MLAKMREERKQEIRAPVSWIEDNNEKFEALEGTLVSRMDIHQEKMDALIVDMKDGRKERMAC